MRSLLMSLILLAPMAWAAAPNCFPGEPTALEKDLQLIQTAEGCIAYVHCDVNHQWVRNYVTGNWLSCKAAIAAMTLASWMNLTHDEKVQLYNATMADKTPDPEDAALSVKAKAIPAPSALPPSGLVTQATTAYKQRQGVNGYSMVAIGSVPLGKPCNASVSAGGFYAVDVALVTMSAPSAPKPTTAYAKCTQ